MKRFLLIFVNLLTLARIIGAIYLFPIYKYCGGISAAVLSFICYTTDLLDGIIARKFKVATFFGSAFDGLADKIFSCANLIVLVSISKFAIIPILFEIAIVTILGIKYKKGYNVKSSIAGKLKTWIISITVILCYLFYDVEKLSFLPVSLLNSFKYLNKNKVMGYLFIPLYIFEFFTIMSYLSFMKTNKQIISKNNFNFKTEEKDFKTFWFDNEFYEKYKNSMGLNELKKEFHKK